MEMVCVGRGEGKASREDWSQPEANQQLVHKPEKEALEAIGGHALRANGGSEWWIKQDDVVL